METAGFGGSCHWCTEAIFQSLKGVLAVKQGWIAGSNDAEDFSEAVLVEFDPNLISFSTLIEVHLHTHSSTSEHSLRSRYRSAIYVFSAAQQTGAEEILAHLQPAFMQPLITEILRFAVFRENDERYRNYYRTDPKRPFCRTYIDPKLRLLMDQFSDSVASSMKKRPGESGPATP